MSYVALYRAFRPQRFFEVVGQEHISRTLINALIQKRVAHAYLFCGPRGTGKTSSAKILAKAVNCLEPKDGEPCNECTNCLAINLGNFLDVLEIDAASNRGIDEIRDIRDKVKFAPSQGKVKVYIIDEVHMLTSEAFNALLKTLEEPPSHVLFILATTEAQRIPLTILSRCQRFDFRKISTKEIKEHLLTLIEQEEIEISDSALNTISRKAAGGMRDAISILDQCIAFAGNTIEAVDVEKVLGTLGEEQILKINEAIVEADGGKVILLINEYLQSGKDVKQVARDLIEFYRQVMLLRLGSGGDMISLSSEILPLVEAQISKLTIPFLGQLILKLNQIEREMRWTSQPQILLEAGLIEVIFDGKDHNIKGTLNTKEAQTAGYVTKSQQVSDSPSSKVKTGEAKIVAKQQVDDVKYAPDMKNTSVDFGAIKRRWPDVLEKVKQSRVTTNAFLVAGEPDGIDDRGSLMLNFQQNHKFHCDQINKPDNKSLVEKAIQDVLGVKVNIACILESQGKGDNSQEGSALDQALELFGGEIVKIKD